MKITNENYIVKDFETVDVEIDYRCFHNEKSGFTPLSVNTSLHQGEELFNVVMEWKAVYERDYSKVEVFEVRIKIEQ